jgi:hypothetical protein
MKTLTSGAKGILSHSGQKLGFRRIHRSGYQVNKKLQLSNQSQKYNLRYAFTAGGRTFHHHLQAIAQSV